MNFQAIFVPRGTPYPDEPSVEMDPGYYVTGAAEDGEAAIALRVVAGDDGEQDVTAEVALTVAAALNRSRFGGEQA